MRVPFFHSLPVRLAGLILLLSGVTLLVLTELNRRAVERILGEEAEIQAAMATAAVVDGLDSVVGATERLARFVARDLEGRTVSAADVERLARNAIVDSPNVFGFSVAFEPRAMNAATERFGTYVHRSNTLNRFVTVDLTASDQAYWQRDWYKETIDKGVPVWSEPFFDQGDADRSVVRISAPFFRAEGDERPIGVVTAVIELEWLRRLANVNEFSDTSHVIVFSRTGRLILHPKPNYAIAETMESLAEKTGAAEYAAIRQNVLARRQGVLTYHDTVTGRRMHVNYRPARTAGWGVVVGYDESEFLKSQRAFRSLAAAFLGSALLILAGIVIGVTRFALRPLAPLAAATGEIARGNLDCAIPVPVRPDEVGHLARAFAAMRDALKAQHLERRWAAQSLAHQLNYNQLIIDSIGELVFVLTKAMNISRINPAVTRHAGYASAELVKVPLARLVRLDAGVAGVADIAQLAERMKAGKSVHELPATIVAKDGTVLRAHLTMAPLLDDNRVVGGVVTLRIDLQDVASRV